MKKLYVTLKQQDADIPIYLDEDKVKYVLSSLGTTTEILYRPMDLRDDGAILFYGETFRPEDVLVIEGELPPRVQRYS